MLIFSIRSWFWFFLTRVLRLLSVTCLPWGLRFPSSPSGYPYAPHWCSVWSYSLVHPCNKASPFPLEAVSRWHDVLRVFLCHISTFVTPHNMQYSPFHFRWHVGSIFFCFSVSDHVWASMIGPGILRIAGRLSLSLVSWLLSARIKPRLLNMWK